MLVSYRGITVSQATWNFGMGGSIEFVINSTDTHIEINHGMSTGLQISVNHEEQRRITNETLLDYLPVEKFGWTYPMFEAFWVGCAR